MVNYIFVTGGVLSGLGKGIVTASIAKLLQARGYKITAMKLDGYLNFDAGTLRPTEHGEVWVTNDGGEIDEDLGHYERFLDVNLSKENNITSGQIFWKVVQNEREGKYLGKTVQMIPHVTDEIKRRIREVAKKSGVDFMIVEIGGTVGDYENALFIEAARQMKFDGEKAIQVHTTYLPVPMHIGEQKTKPTQLSVRQLMSMGVQPDILMCRSERPIDDVRKEKIAMFCNVKKEDVISNPDVGNVYELPIIFEQQLLGERILSKFGAKGGRTDFGEWKAMAEKVKTLNKEVRIGIVGKYFDTGSFQLADSYVSVIEAVRHAAWNNGRKPKIEWIDAKQFEDDPKRLAILKSLDGIIVPGGFGGSGVEGKILTIKYARENDIPLLGLCYGLQLMVVEFARNVCGLKGANTTEIDPKTPHPVVDLLPWQKEIMEKSEYGATMRLGGQTIKITPKTLAHKSYGKTEAVERFRHRYEINPKYVKTLEEKGFVFSGSTPDGNIKQIGELPNHRFMLGVQSHPEFTSRPLRPNPLFDGFIKACIKK